MTLQQLGNLGEFLAALATLLTLVYLALQIRHNTRTVRADSYHAGSTAWAELLMSLASDAALSEIFHQGRATPDQLSKQDMRRFDLILDAMLSQIENLYVQYRVGHLPQSNQDRFGSILSANFRTPGVQHYWARRRGLYTPDFVRYVEEELSPEPLSGSVGPKAAEQSL